jgi:hypothetical protein
MTGALHREMTVTIRSTYALGRGNPGQRHGGAAIPRTVPQRTVIPECEERAIVEGSRCIPLEAVRAPIAFRKGVNEKNERLET